MLRRRPPAGGIGRPDNLLEINVDIIPTAGGASLGVLRAFDITVEESQTQGIFISETTGNLNVHTVHSVRDVVAQHAAGLGLDRRRPQRRRR